MFIHLTSLQTILQDITALSLEVQFSQYRTILLLLCFEYGNFALFPLPKTEYPPEQGATTQKFRRSLLAASAFSRLTEVNV